jgi:hypothetical protein
MREEPLLIFKKSLNVIASYWKKAQVVVN